MSALPFGIDISRAGVYQITNTANGNRYIGSSVNIRTRWKWHMRSLRKQTHYNYHLQNAWNKYGEDSFTFEVLEYCEKERLIEREQFYIDNEKPSYNIAPIAGSGLGCHLSEETKLRLSEARMGELNPNFGNHASLSEGHKQKLSEARKGIKFTEEHKANIGLAKRGNTYRRGSTASDETREKLRLSHLGHVHSEETKTKMSASQKANPNNSGRFVKGGTR